MIGHAVLGPSKANQWLHCTPSVMLESEFPDLGSDYAREETRLLWQHTRLLRGTTCRYLLTGRTLPFLPTQEAPWDGRTLPPSEASLRC
jgi:hypothetical protein